MKRSKGFTLTELMTAMLIHSIFILMLGGTFYTLLSFGSKSQMVMTARERGQRVVNYIGSRIERAGLGLWKLESSDAIVKALNPMTKADEELNGLKLPVSVIYEYDDNINNKPLAEGVFKKKSELTKKNEDKYTYVGNVLTVLYAERDTETGYDAPNLFVKNQIKINYTDANASDVLHNVIHYALKESFWEYFFESVLDTMPMNSSEKLTINFYKKYKNDGMTSAEAAEQTLKDRQEFYKSNGSNFSDKSVLQTIEKTKNLSQYISDISYYGIKYLFLSERSGNGEFFYSKFGKKGKSDVTVNDDNIRAWGVARGTGVPIRVQKATKPEEIQLTPSSEDVIVPIGDELLYLKCIRVFAENPRTEDQKRGVTDRQLKVQKLSSENSKAWNDVNPYEAGILEIYMELDTKTNIFSLWVLSAGGKDNMPHERPKDWPSNARWNNDNYKYYVTYVSKGTWKLNNLRSGFEWN